MKSYPASYNNRLPIYGSSTIFLPSILWESARPTPAYTVEKDITHYIGLS